VVLVLTGLLANFAAAQKPKPAGEQNTLFKIPVWIEAEEGKFWPDASRQFVKVFLGEKEASLKSFQGPKNSTILLVVFDTVSDIARVDQARAVLAEKFKALPQNYWIGVMRVQDGLSVLQEPTADRAAVADKIQSIPVNGKAGLLDTIVPISMLGTEMLRKAGIRLSILYVTDSGIGNYRADYLNPVINSSDAGDLSRRFSDRAVQEQMSRVADSLEKFTVPLFILHLQYRADTMNLAYQSGLERIATASGGGAFFCRTNDEIQPSFLSLMDRIEAAYFLGFEAQVSKGKPARIRVQATDSSGKAFDRVLHREALTQ
jgi:hypothetical protein